MGRNIWSAFDREKQEKKEGMNDGKGGRGGEKEEGGMMKRKQREE